MAKKAPPRPEPGSTRSWTFLSNHAHVLVALKRIVDPRHTINPGLLGLGLQ